MTAVNILIAIVGVSTAVAMIRAVPTTIAAMRERVTAIRTMTVLET